MTIYLFTLDDHLTEDISVIVDMLNKSKGSLKFKILPYRSSTGYYKLYYQSKSLTLESISEICNELKGENNVFENYGILITSKKIEKPKAITLDGKESWYSAFVFKNIAINSNDWEEITEDRSYLAIAHQIIENIFQSLSQINLGSTELMQEIHLNSKGCINDYGRNRVEIYAKIMSGYICKNCQEKFIDRGNDEPTLNQIKSTLTIIRNRITDNYDLNLNVNETISVDKYGQISVGRHKINFGNAKTLAHIYLFYLINHNLKIGHNDFLEKKEIQDKFTSLHKVTGEYKNKFHMIGYVDSMSTYHTRIKKYIQNSLTIESLYKKFHYKSKKSKEYGHHYWLEFESSQVELDPSLQQYRVKV
ncbi:hypothetical protein SAMN05421856_101604 [Chryseobacterium taichungense]|uniref:Uncharacterized protein n=1 Tax=Chryseobacterium taichungense TaxID=295069 RepID=A0A1H7WBT7_9FLAO|nr:hypothetical protein [Chryseobacterium taichungense]SEM18397.1 hypothetical protein SAMN05421856_101604 [Chryseobacterium taichungense]